MSIHSSLRMSGASKKHKSVLKRHERLKSLKEKGLWDEQKSVFGLPKVKMVKIRVKKEKAAAPADAAKAAGAAGEAATAAQKPAQQASAGASKGDKK